MGKESYWYIVVLNVEGHDYLLPGGKTELEARKKAIENLKGEPYELKEYYTRDLTEATRQYKHAKLMESKDIRQAVRPVRHTTPASRSTESSIIQRRQIF